MLKDGDFERVKEGVEIGAYASEVLILKPKGTNLIGLCPFHNEKTGSFVVSKAKQIYKCFGCNSSGDVIRLAQHIERLPNATLAAKSLAARYNIEVTEIFLNQDDDLLAPSLEEIFVANKKAQEFFQKSFFDNKPIKRIIYERGYKTKEEVIKWGI